MCSLVRRFFPSLGPRLPVLKTELDVHRPSYCKDGRERFPQDTYLIGIKDVPRVVLGYPVHPLVLILYPLPPGRPPQVRPVPRSVNQELYRGQTRKGTSARKF